MENDAKEGNNNLIKVAGILPEYDPNWKARHNAAQAELDELRPRPYSAEKQQEMDRAVAKMHEAFWAQFRTADDLKAFYDDALSKEAEAFGAILVTREIPPNASAKDVHAWYADAQRVLEEQRDYSKLPVSQPEGLASFAQELPEDSSRRTFILQYPVIMGRVFEMTARCTMETTPERVSVCFHMTTDPMGKGVINNIERLATGCKEAYFPDLPASKIDFFIHIPGYIFEHRRESFEQVKMDWRNGQYSNPEFGQPDYNSVPLAIRDAESRDDGIPPLPPRKISSGVKQQLFRADSNVPASPGRARGWRNVLRKILG